MTTILALAAVAVAFVVSPGASFALTVAHARPAQAPAWRRITVGTSAGILVLALVVGATGLSTFLTTHPLLRLALGFVGAAVLIGYGVSICVRALRQKAELPQATHTVPERLVRWSFLIVMTNPKALALYVLIVPALHIPDLDGIELTLGFAAVHICLQAAWLCSIHHLVVRIPALADSGRARRRLMVASGLLMVTLGALTAVHSLTQL